MGINGKAVDGTRHNLFSIRARIEGIDYGYDGVEFPVDSPYAELETICISIARALSHRDPEPWYPANGLNRGKVKKKK